MSVNNVSAQGKFAPYSASPAARAIAIFFVPIALACGVQLCWLRGSQSEWRAAAELERLGGRIVWAWRLDDRIQESRFPCYHPPHFVLPGDSFVAGVQLLYCRDERLNEKLASLETLRGLRCLAVTDAPVSQAAFRHLSGLSRLEWLDLHDTPLDDDAARHLSSFACLERLNLLNTHITDASLPHLARFTRLKWLNLCGTGVTPSGLAYLKVRLPDAEILTDDAPTFVAEVSQYESLLLLAANRLFSSWPDRPEQATISITHERGVDPSQF